MTLLQSFSKRKVNLFRLLVNPLLLVVLLFTVACAQLSVTSNAEAKSETRHEAAAVLQPYLGKWRPMSSQRELNLGSITVTETGLSIESGGSVTYEFQRKTDEGVIVRITGRRPANVHLDLTQPDITAFGFSLETQTLESFPPGGPSKKRDVLRICYGLGSIESAVGKLISEMKTKRCPYTYIR